MDSGAQHDDEFEGFSGRGLRGRRIARLMFVAAIAPFAGIVGG